MVFGGTYNPAARPISPADDAWYDTSVKCTPYNPTDARKLVAASGQANPTVHLLMTNATASSAWPQFIQAEEAAVGIKVVIESPTPRRP